MRLTLAVVTSLFVVLSVAGCAQYENKRGVLEQSPAVLAAKFESGKTTRQNVLTELGPPSQVVALGDETVLYYLYEHSRGDGLILVVYNRFKVDTQYDRAIFFFDEQDILRDHASYVADK
jgi:outer membrane protein assembly factor BamE (lipoprotein component of BamABCDE complex)